jgi:hypothetical protein
VSPLIKLDSGAFVWGAAAVNQAASIWTHSITNGDSPADFSWPTVKAAVRDIKVSIENELEGKAAEICRRFTLYTGANVDFYRRFRPEKFDDVGDFDVLAYFPETNQWLIVECKDNQPPFCIKDSRRLRDTIFGRKADRGHMGKMDGRLAFLKRNHQQLRALLKWPDPAPGTDFAVKEVYVSRNLYWWMRCPPYPVTTDFVQVDGLHDWMTRVVSELS